MQLIELTCPVCHGTLQHEPEAYICAKDQKTYPVTFGIPDFRVFHDDVVEPACERSLITQLSKEYPNRSFRDFIELDPTLDPAMPSSLLRRKRAHILGGSMSAKNSLAEIYRLVTLSEKGPFLELGCGPGGFLVAAADMFETVVGLDISLPRLIVAKKQLEETGRRTCRPGETVFGSALPDCRTRTESLEVNCGQPAACVCWRRSMNSGDSERARASASPCC